MRRRLFLRGLLGLALACLLLVPPAQGWGKDAFIDETATWLANGRKVHIRCLTEEESREDTLIGFWGASAYVEGWLDGRGYWHPFRYSVFGYGICEPLQALRAGDASAWKVSDIAWALMALTHESGHLRGHRWSEDEALTQAWALRHTRYTAARFGVSGEALVLVMRHVVRWHLKLPQEYRTEACRNPSIDPEGKLVGCDW